MKLPNAHLAIVEEQKVTGYLSNSAHRYGASKAQFFLGKPWAVHSANTDGNAK